MKRHGCLTGNNKHWLNNFEAQCKNIYCKLFLKPGKISIFCVFNDPKTSTKSNCAKYSIFASKF